jgi:hypothetical protein
VQEVGMSIIHRFVAAAASLVFCIPLAYAVPIVVSNTNGAGTGSLGDAIAIANATCGSGPYTITFNIPGTGPHTISPTSALPTLACNGTVIDGYTQAFAMPNTQTGASNDADIRVILDGTSSSAGNGLTINAANVTVRGLAVKAWLNNGIFLSNATSAQIIGNYFGTDPGGMTPFPNGLSGVSGSGDGIFIGGASPGERNLITGSLGYGSSVQGGGVHYVNNQIGGDRSGGAAIVNFADGVYLNGGSGVSILDNQISRNNPGVTLTSSATGFGNITGNVFHHNTRGIVVGSTATYIANNTFDANSGVGIDASGDNNTFNTNTITNNLGDGVRIIANDNSFFDNLVTGNGGAGLRVMGGNDNGLRQNRAYANSQAGIVLGAGSGGSPNDEASLPYDADAGPNGFQNYPVLTVYHIGPNTVITGTLKTGAGFGNAAASIDFFSNPAPPSPSGGQVFQGSTFIDLDANGVGTINFMISGLVNYVTATATFDSCGDGCSNDTSEYSPPVTAVLSTGAVLVASPVALNFGSQTVGLDTMSQFVTVTNQGPGTVTIASVMGSGDFPFASYCGSTLVMSDSCQVEAYFHPLAVGNRTGSIMIASDAAASPLTISLSGIGLRGPTPSLSLSPEALVFAAQDVGTTSLPMSARLANQGDGDLVISGFDASSDFTVLIGEGTTERFADAGSGPKAGKARRIVRDPPFTTCPNVIPPGGQCDIVVVFEPTEKGPRSGLLIVESNAPTGSASIRLLGTGGTAPTRFLELPSVVDFGEQSFGERSVGRPITITNASSERVSIIDLVADGDFTVGDTCLTIEVRGSCTVMVFFKPTALGLREGSLTLRTQGEAGSYRIDLRGFGAPNPRPLLRLSVQSLGFGSATGPRSMPVTVVNEGQQPVVFSLISGIGDFMAVSRCGTRLEVGTSCVIDVTFFPRLTGPRLGELRVESNAVGSPHTAQLSAVGCRVPAAAFSRTRTLLCGPGN